MLVNHSVAWNDSHCSPDELVISQPAVPWILPLRPQTVQLWACRLRLGCFNQKIKSLWVFVCIQTSSLSSFAWFTIQNNPSLCHTEPWPSFSVHPAWNELLLLTPAFLRLALPSGGYAPPPNDITSIQDWKKRTNWVVGAAGITEHTLNSFLQTNSDFCVCVQVRTAVRRTCCFTVHSPGNPNGSGRRSRPRSCSALSEPLRKITMWSERRGSSWPAGCAWLRRR